MTQPSQKDAPGAGPATAPATVPVNVDGRVLALPAGANLLDALGAAGIEVPHFCYHPRLSVAGNCRMCLVETGSPARDRATGAALLGPDGAPKINWSPKLAPACSTTVAPGLHVRLDSPAVRENRAGVIEFLLANHPLDCPVCDQAGECRLQDYAARYGRRHSRCDEPKTRKPKNVRSLGPRLVFDAERCILCGRCVRFCREILHAPVLNFTKRGARAEIAAAPGHPLDHPYSLNAADLCPVGALTDAAFRFKMRAWFLKKTPGVSDESSTGANTWVWHREGVVHRVTPRRNDAVNGFWLSDAARDIRRGAGAGRAAEYLREGVPVTPEAAAEAAAALLRESTAGGSPPTVVLSSLLTLEEFWLVREILAGLGGGGREPADAPVFLPSRAGAADGFLVSADHAPNTRGALLAGVFNRAPDAGLSALADAIAAGGAATLFVLRENIAALSVPPELLRSRRVRLVYLTDRFDATAACADVVLPALGAFERAGSFVNNRFRLQRFDAAVAPPAGVVPEIEILARIAGIEDCRSPADVWRRIAAGAGDGSPLAAVKSFDAIPPDGLPLDGSRWASLALPDAV